MSKHPRNDSGNGEASPSPTGNASPATPSIPVQVTNVVQILADNLPGEYTALMIHIKKLDDQKDAAAKYKAQLERLASDADITLSPQG